MRSLNYRHRSSLVTPADRPQCDKAIEVGADIAVTDLEDSIRAGFKASARSRAMSSFSSTKPITRGLRINSPHSEEGVRDLVALLDSGAKPEILHLPKVESPEDILLVEHVIADKLPEARFWAIIETARGLSKVFDIAGCSQKLDGLVFGAGDFSRDMNISLEWSNLLFARQQIVLAATSVGIRAIDSPCFPLGNPLLLRQESEKARGIGFSGKIAIHPDQVSIINEIFTPGVDTFETAKEIIEASHATADAIFVVNGRMVGPPMVAHAVRTLDIVSKVYKDA